MSHKKLIIYFTFSGRNVFQDHQLMHLYKYVELPTLHFMQNLLTFLYMCAYMSVCECDLVEVRAIDMPKQEFYSLLCKMCPNEEFSDTLSRNIGFFAESRHHTHSAVDDSFIQMRNVTSHHFYSYWLIWDQWVPCTVFTTTLNKCTTVS